MRVHGAGTGPQRAARARVPKALHDCGVPRTDVCSHGRTKGGSAASPVSIAMFLTQSTVSARSAKPSLHPASVRRRAEARRRAASQRHGPWPWLIDLGRLGKGQVVGKKGCGKLRTTNTRRRARADMCVLFCVSLLLCLCAFVSPGHLCVSGCLSLFGCLFVCSFVCFVCLVALSCVFFVCCMRVCALACALLSWAEQ